MSIQGDLRKVGIESNGDNTIWDVEVFDITNKTFAGLHVERLTLDATVGLNGTMAAWENKWSGDALVSLVVLNVTTAATGAATSNVGASATATGTADDIIDGTDIGTAAIVANNISSAGTNGLATAIIPTGEYVTIRALADPAGLVGNMWVYFTNMPA